MTAGLRSLNSLGAALRISRSGAVVQSEHLADVDTLTQIFGHVELEDLLSVAQTCVLWHVVAQRVSLLLQLQCSAPPSVDYPAYLSLLAELSNVLDADACWARATEHTQWASLDLTKEVSGGRYRSLWARPCMFTKAAGCTTMRTVEAVCPRDEVRRITLPLRSPQTAFMVGPRKEGGATGRRHDAPRGDDLVDEIKVLAQRLEGTRVAPADLPPAASCADDAPPVVIRVADDALRHTSIELFRQYFSPSMHFVFPLIAHQQAVNGLDFTTTQTWGVGVDGQPVGAVAWRVREPLMKSHDRDAARLPVRTLEVLFISIQEKHRKMDYGGVLVAAVEDEASTRGCAMLYVEVGHEQPLARKFWAKQGFAPASEIAVSCEQRLFFEHACLRFSDTEPFIKRLSQEHRSRGP